MSYQDPPLHRPDTRRETEPAVAPAGAGVSRRRRDAWAARARQGRAAWSRSSTRRRWAIAALVLLLAFLVPSLVAYQRCGLAGCPDVSRLGAFQPNGAPVVLDRNGERFAELKLADRTLVELDSLPEYLPQAFLAVEDKRFYEHDGVDFRRVGGALVANVEAGGIEEGSSTITMQLARNVFSDRIPGQKRTLWRKVLEVRVGREIEDRYGKDEILELYLNNIFFGGGAQGIEAASRQYFGKPASEVGLPQAALLAALPKAPTHYDPRRHPERAKERRDLVLALMADQGRITPEQEEEARAAELGVASRGRLPEVEVPPAPYFVERVRQELEALFGDQLYREPLRIVTTLDLGAQEAFESSLQRQLRNIEHNAFGRFHGTPYRENAEIGDEGTPYLQGAAVALDARTGDVLAWVGGRDFRDSRFDRVSQARRQVGSAFKPFVYTAALAEGHPPSEVISDRPVTVDLGHGQQWRPKNFEGHYSDSVSLRQAVVSSKNTATVRVAHAVGFDRVADYAERLGFEGDLPRRPSLALGTAVASPLELATAYTPFASLGHRVEPRLVLRVESPEGEVLWESSPERERLLDPGLAYLMTDILQDVVNRGTGYRVRRAGFRGHAAGKTGTTNEGQDVWFVGFTPDVVAGVWIGFDQPRSIQNRASGGLLAAPVWGRAMRQVYAGRPDPGGWPRPTGVVEAEVDPASGMILAPGCRPVSGPPAKEIFLAGLTPTTTCPRWTEGERRDGFFDRMAAWGDTVWDRFAEDEPRDGTDGEEAQEGLAELEGAADIDGDGTIDIRPSRLRERPEAESPLEDRTAFPADQVEDVTEGFEDRDLDGEAARRPAGATERRPIVIRRSRPDESEADPEVEQPVLPIPDEPPPAGQDEAEPPPEGDEAQLPDDLFEEAPPEEAEEEDEPPPPRPGAP
jgi:penicillin-binding protein 1A